MSKYERLRAELQASPGKWEKFPAASGNAEAVASALRHGPGYAAFTPREDYEVAVRADGVYIRRVVDTETEVDFTGNEAPATRVVHYTSLAGDKCFERISSELAEVLITNGLATAAP